MTRQPSPRERVLAVLNGERVDRSPVFGGLINVTQAGLDGENLALCDVHADSRRMATAATTTHRLSGFASAVVPLDMTVEAEVLGAVVDFESDSPEPRFPRIVEPLASSATELEVRTPDDLLDRGRIPVVREAIAILGRELGEEAAVGAWVPGPFTVATLVVDVGNLLMETRTAPDAVGAILDPLTDILGAVAHGYHDAGADFLTVHEMGGSPGFIGPSAFEDLVLPRLQRLLEGLPAPRVLSVCGHTNASMELLAASGADALSVDQLNDLEQSREVLGPDAVLLGNIDPIATLADGDAETVRQAVAGAIDAGVNAVWPGCDLLPQLPATNLIALVEAAGQASSR